MKSSNFLKVNKRLNYVTIIGWNDRIKSLHKNTRNAFSFCHDHGKPRNINIFEAMKEIRK